MERRGIEVDLPKLLGFAALHRGYAFENLLLEGAIE